MKAPLLTGLLLGVIGAAPLAQAHPLPARNAMIQLNNDRVALQVAVPVSALSGIDDNHDGLLSGEELSRHTGDIVQQFTRRFQVTTAGADAVPDFVWVTLPQAGSANPPPSAYVVVLAAEHFSAKPSSLSVSTSLFGGAVGEGQMVLRVQRGDARELAVLDKATPQHVFFQGLLASLGGFIKIGVEHILLGPDHLLFLLTVVVAGANWRYWAGIITSFTVAHSITLSLAALGVINVSSAVVEPAIAASIVLMASDNLIRQARIGRERIVLVLGCGLLHGLGFASALGEIGLDAGHRIASLAGFNIGVEIGQVMFVVGVLGVSHGLGVIGGKPMRRLLPAAVSGLAVVAGALMLIERVAPLLGWV